MYLRDLFSTFFSERRWTTQSTPKLPPERFQRCPTTPQRTSNLSSGSPKSDIFGLLKTIKNHWFYWCLSTLGHLGSDVWPIKTAIVSPTALRTPKNRGLVGKVVPKVTQRSPNGVRKVRDFELHFEPKSSENMVNNGVDATCDF